MTVFSKKVNNNNTENLVQQINQLLSELGGSKEQAQSGGSVANRNLVAEVNNLLSEIRGTQTNLSESEVMDLAAQRGGKRKRGRKTKSKKSKKSKRKRSRSKSKKTKSKRSRKGRKAKRSSSRSQQRSRRRKTVAKSKKTKSASSVKKVRKQRKTKSKSKRSRSRGAGNSFIADLTKLKAFIKAKLPNEDLNHIVMSTPASKLLKDNNRDVEQSKKSFNATSFMREYAAAKKTSDAKKAAKKARA